MSAEAAPQYNFTGLDYLKFFTAGAFCTGFTHAALVPVDVVKTRIQLDSVKYNNGMIGSLKTIVSEEGAGALLTGFGPTALGYSIQGACKFGGYEIFKKLALDTLGYETAVNYKNSIYIGSAAAAEFVADVFLCPLEATRIRLVSQPTFAPGLLGGFSRILKEEGFGSFYSGFTPILFKQIPYNISKFLVYERATEFYSGFLGPKETLTAATATLLSLASGLTAGFAAAVVSQPADTLLSKVNKTKKAPGQSTIGLLAQLAKELGVVGSFAGLPARLVMVGTLTSLQFGIYGSVKSYIGCAPSVEIGGKGH
ncbi:hypothetical protein FOG51_00399 [Hanseniaspora uvarum]|uniref:Mitochondrial phosphate carrier protein n=1 Tax=Hanseniaspora uvarum TaxID=29833 RepID=A0A1E5RCM7_HANUV|nr:hypothetical protein FOG48_03166 [Hanseniaspora uvarum]KAF0274572.1 hypothetical protein FOG51_00399 [Hanseniaspora uvarum]KAF0278162.1 hypothetical protein FOG50_00988 [Hanseniaspora uvarum]OEJ84654.1 Mitochondrial phosphate carrier protein [Hanseniaspora uvarum]GMM41439.1 Mir1 protein [Hanseniaspora uvarum]